MGVSRVVRSRVFLALAVVLVAASMHAQNTGPYWDAYGALLALDVANAQGHANVGFAPVLMSIPDRPFTATRTFSDHRYTPDATDLSADCTIARDEKGRIHYEMAFESSESGKLAIGGYDTQIYDPVAHTLVRYFMTADRGLPPKAVAEVRYLKLMSELMRPLPAAPAPDPNEDSRYGPAPSDNSAPPSPSDLLADRAALAKAPPAENLPKRSFDGIIAIGYRSVIRYGQKQEFFQIQENWISPKYAMDMRQVVLRESIGKETVETHDVEPGAPDPALFEIPPGYVVRRVK